MLHDAFPRRRFGHQLLVRYGYLVRIDAAEIKLGQFLFLRHGGKVVLLGRFIAVLRTLAALLAGINCMPWWRFLFFNAAGGVIWAAVYGLAAYELGHQIEQLRASVAIGGLVLAAIAAIVAFRFVRHHQAELQAEAERAMPGPIQHWRTGGPDEPR